MLTPYEPIDLDGLLKLFAFEDKSALERYARSCVIYQDDLVALISACKQGALPLRHMAHYSERVPQHLVPSESDRRALAQNGVGRLKPPAVKTMRKVAQWFREGRTLAGHMFVAADVREWHFLCLDQHDLSEESPNHWSGGAHVHFVNWLWPNLDPARVWSQFVLEDRRPGSSLHVRFRAEAA